MRWSPLALLLVCACAGERPSSITMGENRLAVPGGEIWYRVSGTDSAGRLPVILLHGGPGFSSVYMKTLEDLGNQRVVIRYDQLGGGHSGPMTDTAMMNIAHFVAELDSLRAHLGVERMHVLGSSWGTILGIEYWKAHPDRVASLTFQSPVFDVPEFTAYVRSLVRTLPDSMQRAVRRAEDSHKFDDPGYLAAMNQFYGMYVFRNPRQPDLDSLFASANQAIYNYMQGPSEFTITGTLTNYKALDVLPRVTIPVLVTAGEFDEVGPDIARRHAGMMPNARFELIPGAAHVTMWDAAETNTRVVREFLLQADSAEARR